MLSRNTVSGEEAESVLALDFSQFYHEAFQDIQGINTVQSMHDVELVSVIVPAYNAERTLGDTLDSIRRQTHSRLEIIVVDDGSRDRTAAIAETHAAEDDRIRLIRQENGGVARARNAGAAASRGAYLAPVDADDLWHPEKIERQLALIRSDPEIGFVYTYFRRIDPHSRITASFGERVEGKVFLRAILQNFVSNGSSLLIRRAAFEAAGGYEPALRARGVEGCEDVLLQILTARDWQVACVPEYLTGYRVYAGAMSSDQRRMTHSHCAVLEIVAQVLPDTPEAVLAAAEARMRAMLGVRDLRRLRLRSARDELARALHRDPRTTLTIAAQTAWSDARSGFARRMGRLMGRPGAATPGPAFHAVTPTQLPHSHQPHALERHIRASGAHEAALARRSEAKPTAPEVESAGPGQLRG